MARNLDSQSRSDLASFLAVQTKKLGIILQEADLITASEIESALKTQIYSPHLKIGEILVQQDLIEPETANFFVRDWSRIIIQPEKDVLGYYLEQAAILDREQIEIILSEQRSTGIRFGTVAVFQGFLKSTTLDFFLANLFPEQLHVSPFINMYRGSSLR
jgi:hypothetical protein